MDNMTLKIDRSGDLVIDEDGLLETIKGTATTAQNIRMTLKAGKKDFALVPEHGTDYSMVFGVEASNETIREAYREAIFQETDVEQINSLSIDTDKREVKIDFTATTTEGIEIGGST